MDQTTNTEIGAILTEMATLTTMERGTLSEEHRTRPASNGRGTVRLGLKRVRHGLCYSAEAFAEGLSGAFSGGLRARAGLRARFAGTRGPPAACGAGCAMIG